MFARLKRMIAAWLWSHTLPYVWKNVLLYHSGGYMRAMIVFNDSWHLQQLLSQLQSVDFEGINEPLQ